MLHRIETGQIELGMYIHSLDGSWLQHSFWRSRFLVDDREQIERLIASGIGWVTIDDTKGRALPVLPVPLVNNARTRTLDVPQRSATIRKFSADAIAAGGVAPLSSRERAAEVRRASSAIKRSRIAVMSMFEDARLGNAVKAKQMAPLVEQISASVAIDPTIILNIARLKTKDEYTYLHSVAVCALMIHLARRLGLPEAQIEDIGMAGLLHDVGKTSIPDSILLKPGKLDDAEWIAIRNHPERGHAILLASKGISNVALDVCLSHHEKIDGTGYPNGIAGDSLSLVSRMSSICDVYDAITSQRPYNVPLSASQALAKMESWPGHFDKLILRSFVDSLGVLPMGTLVRLTHDRLGIVIGESLSDFASPIVRVFHCLESNRAVPVHDVDTSLDQARAIFSVEDPADWGFSDWAGRSATLLAANRGQSAFS